MIVDTLGCNWDIARLLIFSKNVFSPFVYYSHFFPIIGSVLLGLFVYRSNRTSLTARLFFSITLIFSIWAFADVVLWADQNPAHIMFFWSLTILLEPFIYIFGLYFLMASVRGSDITANVKKIFLILLAPTILLTASRFGLMGFNYTNCDREVIEGPLVYYGYLVEIIIALWTIVYAMRAYQKVSTDRKKPIIFISLGIVLFFLAFAWGNIVGSLSDDWSLGQYGLFGVPVFLAFMMYAIVKFRAFNIKLIGAQALIMMIIILIGSEFFFVQTSASRILVTLTLILTVIIGVLLVRSVKKEVEQREYLEKISKELSSANDQLRTLDKQKNEFLSFASHDLKSPIALIKQFATLIYDGTYKEPQKVHETVLKIKNTADRAVNMVNTFLDLRKIEEGHMDYNFEKKNIIEFVSGITSDFALIAKQQKNIDITFSSSSPTLEVSIDTNTFRQVIQNFLDNSLKYTEAGWIKVTIAEEQKTILIKISDSGLGMDKELLPVLFGQFHRDPGAAKKIQGTGLGLYISKQIVIAHHGETWAESEGKGKGSQFYIRLPKA